MQNIQDSIAERKDDAVDSKMMGIDHLFVDESHQFKNLIFNTRHDRVSGLGNPDGSQRVLNMLFAIRTIQERSGKDLGQFSFQELPSATHLQSWIYYLSIFVRKH